MRIKSSDLCKAKAFSEGLHKSGNANLVDHLRQLPGAGWTHEAAGPGISGDHGLSFHEIIPVAAAHDGQLTIFRSGLAPRNRRIEKSKSARFRLAIELSGNRGGRSRVIDKHGARRNARERSILSKGDRP